MRVHGGYHHTSGLGACDVVLGCTCVRCDAKWLREIADRKMLMVMHNKHTPLKQRAARRNYSRHSACRNRGSAYSCTESDRRARRGTSHATAFRAVRCRVVDARGPRKRALTRILQVGGAFQRCAGKRASRTSLRSAWEEGKHNATAAGVDALAGAQWHSHWRHS